MCQSRTSKNIMDKKDFVLNEEKINFIEVYIHSPFKSKKFGFCFFNH